MLANRGSPFTQAQCIICLWNLNILAHILQFASFFLLFVERGVQFPSTDRISKS
jgi:hypothetical protein